MAFLCKLHHGLLTMFFFYPVPGIVGNTPGTMTQSMIRRTLKNLVQNFSEAEVKVKENFTVTIFALAELISSVSWNQTSYCGDLTCG